jgi:hypothetical protein
MLSRKMKTYGSICGEKRYCQPRITAEPRRYRSCFVYYDRCKPRLKSENARTSDRIRKSAIGRKRRSNILVRIRRWFTGRLDCTQGCLLWKELPYQRERSLRKASEGPGSHRMNHQQAPCHRNQLIHPRWRQQEGPSLSERCQVRAQNIEAPGTKSGKSRVVARTTSCSDYPDYSRILRAGAPHHRQTQFHRRPNRHSSLLRR